MSRASKICSLISSKNLMNSDNGNREVQDIHYNLPSSFRRSELFPLNRLRSYPLFYHNYDWRAFTYETDVFQFR